MDALCKLGENKMPTILRKRPAGKRFEYITKEELDTMLAAGSARKLGAMPSYEEVEVPPAPVQKAELEPKTYETRELRATQEPRRSRRTRTR
jgi:hypothetical protein